MHMCRARVCALRLYCKMIETSHWSTQKSLWSLNCHERAFSCSAHMRKGSSKHMRKSCSIHHCRGGVSGDSAYMWSLMGMRNWHDESMSDSTVVDRITREQELMSYWEDALRPWFMHRWMTSFTLVKIERHSAWVCCCVLHVWSSIFVCVSAVSVLWRISWMREGRGELFMSLWNHQKYRLETVTSLSAKPAETADDRHWSRVSSEIVKDGEDRVSSTLHTLWRNFNAPYEAFDIWTRCLNSVSEGYQKQSQTPLHTPWKSCKHLSIHVETSLKLD